MQAIEAVRAAEARLRAAQFASDVAGLEALLADDLVFIAPDGRRMRKPDDLAVHASGQLRFQRLEVEDEHFHPVGDTVVAFVRARVAGEMAGEGFAGVGVWTRVWRAGSDGWRLAAAHCAAFPEGL
jgi:ketosteroid isomerase-like protein